MKNLYLIIVAFLLGISIIACGGSSGDSDTSTNTPDNGEQSFAAEGNYLLSFRSAGTCYLSVGSDNNITGVAENSDDVYTISGSVNQQGVGTALAQKNGVTIYTFSLTFSENGVTGTWQGSSENGSVSGSSLVGSGNNTPVILGNPHSSITAGSSYSFTPVAYDYDGDSLSFSITGIPAWASFNTLNGTISGTPSASDAGTYNIVITVSDGRGGSSECSFSVTVNATNSAPVLPSNNFDAVININTPYQIQITAYDPDGDSITYSATGLPSWLNLNASTGLLSGTPLSSGEHLISYTATDSRSAHSTITFTINVIEPLGSGRFVRDALREIVTDTVTDAVWQDNADLSNNTFVMTWSAAVSYCDNLVLGGYSDWYLPSLAELQTTQRYEGSSVVGIDTAFNNLPTYPQYWTSTVYPEYAGFYYIMGYASPHPSLGSQYATNSYVRCVR